MVLELRKFIILILSAICITGIVGIPMGDPKFIAQAISLESAFVILTFISWKKFRFALVPNIILGIIVIIGNTVSPQHIEIMSSLTPIGNAVVLIIGGYILQVLLVSSSIISLKNKLKN